METKVVESTTKPVRALRVSVVGGRDAQRSVSAPTSIAVGTSQANDLVLSDDTVSRYHLEITRDEQGQIVLCDHGSTNGTILSGARLTKAILSPKTVLQVGHSSLLIDDGETVSVELFEGGELSGVVGYTPVMQKLMAKLQKASGSNASILLLGETGSGKEVLARAIHGLSPRVGQPFETVDCGMMVPTLIGSELFGHEKGAFTGAHQQHLGAFERADGGTLFLDEIGELPPGLQTALLGALERRTFRRVGGSKTIEVDVRVVCATNRDLRNEVNAGRFRQDLYYRMAVVHLTVPPLRDRLDDIPHLAEHFLRRAGYDGPLESILATDAVAALKQHSWPGNVRELRNAVESMLIMGEAPQVPAGEEITDAGDEAWLSMSYNEARATVLDHFEHRYITALLERAAGSVSDAARMAKMSRTYLTKLLRRRGLRGSK